MYSLFFSRLCYFSLKCFVTCNLWQSSSLQMFCKYICHSTLWLISAESRETRGRCPNKLFQQHLKARSANAGGYEITSVFHLLQKMASNKVQTVLGGRVVQCWRRTRWKQTGTDSFPATAICCVAVALGHEPRPTGYCLHQHAALSALCWGNTAKRERGAASHRAAQAGDAAGVWTYETPKIKGGRRSSSAARTPFFTLKIEGKKLAITILGVSQRSATFVRKGRTSSAT